MPKTWFQHVRNFFCHRAFSLPRLEYGRQILLWGEGFMRDKTTMNDLGMLRRRRDDGLGPNSDIGNKLRALYGAVQSEEIPSKLIDLLEQLDAVEKQSKPAKGK
ncbi:NepR family anti-sigma factor [Devosia sp.]|jgi:hypothetical protein|uniref:NepR family anti-sigma factor n=1 Tax=Devosia sp. TaxID=1871048 RepID=UPI0039C8AC30